MDSVQREVIERDQDQERWPNGAADLGATLPSPSAQAISAASSQRLNSASVAVSSPAPLPALTWAFAPAGAWDVTFTWEFPPITIYDLAKRALDIIFSLIGLVIALPVMAVVGFIVWLDSPGPVVFRQVRVAQNGRPFTFYKFRTMYVDARERFPELYAYHYSHQEIQTMYFKVLYDPRLTRVGRHLRKTSLDELPNLFNVLRGDMTLVGPRPEIPEMLKYYTPEQLVKFSVKPGVTGLAQVTGRSVLRFQQTIAADVEYVQRRSLWFDLEILVRTVKTVLLRVGAF